MGLSKQGWKQMLQKRYPKAFLSKIDDSVKINVIMEEGGSNKFSILNNPKTGWEIDFRVMKKVCRDLRRADTFIYLFDSPAPINKSQTQLYRRRNKESYSEQEILEMAKKQILPFSVNEIPHDRDKILNTELVYKDYLRHISEFLCSINAEKLLHHMRKYAGASEADCQEMMHQIDKKEIIVLDARLTRIRWERHPDPTRIEDCFPQTSLYHVRKRLNSNDIEFLDYFHIGEAELKIPMCILKQPKATFLVNCPDTDLFPILLNSMRDLIDQQTHTIEAKIFLDLTTAQARSQEEQNAKTDKQQKREDDDLSMFQIVDMVALWRLILNDFVFTKGIKLPAIETLCCLMTLGSDYVESLPNISTETILQVFFRYGHEVVSRNGGLFLDCGQTKWRDPLEARPIVLIEHNWLLLFRLCFTEKLTKDKTSNTTLTWEEIAAKIEQNRQDALRKNSRPGIWKDIEITEDYMHSIVRRMYWLMQYWINGAKVLFIDPVEIDPVTKKSKYGWIMTPSGCQPAKEVSIESIPV